MVEMVGWISQVPKRKAIVVVVEAFSAHLDLDAVDTRRDHQRVAEEDVVQRRILACLLLATVQASVTIRVVGVTLAHLVVADTIPIKDGVVVAATSTIRDEVVGEDKATDLGVVDGLVVVVSVD